MLMYNRHRLLKFRVAKFNLNLAFVPRFIGFVLTKYKNLYSLKMLKWIVRYRTVFMYKNGFAWNNLQWLICHKTKQKQTRDDRKSKKRGGKPREEKENFSILRNLELETI